MEKRIRLAITYSGKSQSDIASSLGMSRASFNAKLKRDTWTFKELASLAFAIGCEYLVCLSFPDGSNF